MLPKGGLIILGCRPCPDGFEGLPVQKDEASLSIFVRPVSEGGDHDIAIGQTVSGMRSAHPERMNLPRLDHLVQLGVAGVSLHVHDVDSVRAEAGDDQPRPGTGRVVVATAAGVPASVMDLISNVRKVEARNNLELQL